MRQIPLAAALALAAAVPCAAATLRPLTTLSAPVVLLSDLFDDAGPQAARVLGPAPLPGQRIVVESAQLAAIARQFGVDWRPASSADRAVLEQPGRRLGRESLLPALRAALARAGAPAEAEIVLSDFQPPLIPLLARPRVQDAQTEFDAASGRFTATLLLDGVGQSRMPLDLTGRVEATEPVVLPLRNLPAGATIRAADLHVARMRASALRGEVLHDTAQAVGLTLRRPAPAELPLHEADLVAHASVNKGARVVLEIRTAGLFISATGIAMDSGAVGERVSVQNPTSHQIIEGVVVGADRVAVSPAGEASAAARVAER